MPVKAVPQSLQNIPDNRIALKFDESGTYLPTSEELQTAREIGIELLEVSFPTQVNHSLLRDFYLLLESNYHFPTIYEMESNRESIIHSLLSNYNNVPGQLRRNIAAVKLFDFPADYHNRFPLAVDELTSQLADSIDNPIFYQSAYSNPAFRNNALDFVSGRMFAQGDISATSQLPVLLFEPSEDAAESLHSLEYILNQSLSHSESIVIIPADWFFARMEAQEAFPQIISSYLNGNSIAFPMPAANTGYPQVNWPVVFLLVIWASFIIHYKHQPMYKATLPRYFFNHSFFVYDVMEQRIRNVSSGIIVLIQHALLTGFFFYLLADAFISKTGLQALAIHFPAFFYPGFEELCLFLIGLTIALFSHALSIAWLYFFNKQLNQISQVINLYSWPLHINLLIVTLVVYFTQLSSAYNWLIIAASAYFIVWFFSFNIAAINGSRFLDKFRTLNLFLTVGIHFLFISLALILIFVLPSIFEPLEMAFRLP